MKHASRSRFACQYVLAALMISLVAMPAAKAASAQAKPGDYCPSTNILLIVAEDLSTSLDFVMQSRAALARGDQPRGQVLLDAAGITMVQASSRGAGARTALLIDSTIRSRVNERNEQLLAWFPLLHSALLTLPADDARNAAEDAIGRAEEILRDGGSGDPMKLLKLAGHFLSCDDLNLPLQAAIKEQQRLSSQIRQHKPLVTKDYDDLIDSLRTAMTYVLDHGQT